MNISQSIAFVLFSIITYSVAAQQQNAVNYGRTIISVSPVQMSERTPTGFGIQYERFLGMSGKFSLYLPLAYSFGQSDPCDPTIKSRVFYAYPGIKFYPAGNQHTVTYSVGSSLAFGHGASNCDCTDPAAVTNEFTPKKFHPVTEMGALINNSINVQATDRINLGAEVGIGATYLSVEDGHNMGTDLMLQMNLRLGYRF